MNLFFHSLLHYDLTDLLTLVGTVVMHSSEYCVAVGTAFDVEQRDLCEVTASLKNIQEFHYTSFFIICTAGA